MKSDFRAAILAYHSHTIYGDAYQQNDLLAFAEDLAMIQANGLNLVTLAQIAECIVNGAPLPERSVALSCDDGADYDFIDILHETWGKQTSLGSSVRKSGQAALTSFVIAEAEARREIDEKCLAGVGRMNDFWWADAVASGHIHIGNHSWDHQHRCLDRYSGIPNEDIEFRKVNSCSMADYQIRQSAALLRNKCMNPGCGLFAYPYGHWSEYLVEEYFPRYQSEHGVLAAFTTEPEIVHSASSRWLLPRFVCGQHWRTQSELIHILSQI